MSNDNLQQDPLINKFYVLSKYAGYLVIFIGLSVIIGWALDITLLKSIFPKFVSMNPITAICFCITGIPLCINYKSPSSSITRRIVQLCSVILICIGIFHVADYYHGINIKIDQILFHEKLISNGETYPNEMAPNTAFNFFLLGLAFLTLNLKTRRGFYPSQWISLTVLFIGLLAVIGYIYSVHFLYSITTYIPMALNTALAFIIASHGVLFSRPDQGFMKIISSPSIGGITARRLLPASVIFPIVLGWLRIYGETTNIYDRPFGISLMTLSMIFIFVVLIWWTSRAIHFIDIERTSIQQERDRFFNISQDLFCIANFNGYFIQLNPAWEKTLGFTRKELLSEPFISFIHPEDLTATVTTYKEQEGGKDVIAFENRYRCKDGSYRWLLWNAVSLPSENLIFASARDVTNRKLTEEEIGKLNSELKNRILEVDTVNKELESFSYSVSHDLRAPLRGIDGFSQALLEDYFDKLDLQGKDYLNRIRTASQRMGHLIDDMLKLSKVTRSEIHSEPVNLSEIAHSLADELKKSHTGRDIEFLIAQDIVVTGDPFLLRVVLENLFLNAWKFTSKHPKAKIEFGVTQQNGKTAYFVRDDGVGFDMTYADKLFGAFQRLHSMEEFEGTGIGLATVQRIIHRHGGQIWAEGAVGKGATFYFTIQEI